MTKTFLIAVISWLTMAMPGGAYTLNLYGTYVPQFGEFELLEYVTFAPYELKVINSQTFLANEEEPPYHFMEAWTSLEMGLGNDLSTSLVLPVNAWRQFDGRDNATGLYDISWQLTRKLWRGENHSGRLRFQVDLGNGDAERGLGAGAPGLGLQHTLVYYPLPQLRAILNLSYHHSLRKTMVDRQGALITAWPGQRVLYGTALEWFVNDSWAVILEQLGQWEGPAHDHRQIAAESGSNVIQLAPGVTWTLSDQLALQAGVVLPVVRQGYQDSYRWSAVFGTVLDF